MKCPLCNVEGRIKASGYVINQGTLSMKQQIICRNKECPNYNKVFYTNYIPLTVRQDSEAPVVNTEPESEETPVEDTEGTET